MPRPPRYLPQGHSFPITLRCNSRQFLMDKGLKRDVLLAVPIGWYSAMALNRLSGRCGHLWEASYYATAIAPKDHGRVLNTLRYIHANL